VIARTLTQRELNRSILARQMLLRREGASALDAMERLVGMQAQEPIDPYVGLWARLEGFQPQELSDLLAERRAVRVVMLYRTTIHLVSARDCLAIRPLLQPVAVRQFGYSPFARNLAGLDVQDVADAGRSLIEERPRTANEVGRVLAERWPGHDVASLGYATRFLVPLVQVPPRGLWARGGKPVLATVEQWLGAELDPQPSIEALVRRYLGSFGPASAADVRTWSWLTGVREVLEGMRPTLVTYRDEAGRELFDVPDAPFPDPDTPAPVRLLPEYDNLFLSHDDRSRVADPGFRLRTWMRGSLLVDGFLRGTWRLDAKADPATLRIGIHEPLVASERHEVEAEARRLHAFLTDGAAAHRIELVNLD
jgi:winged helix DNA-binding protein